MDELSFEQVVEMHYQPLYRFAFGLTGRENDAWDLTQQTFYRWATKGQQLRDKSKVKSWLFTTLHREFLNSRRREVRFPHVEADSAAHEMPPVPPAAPVVADSHAVLEALTKVEEPYRAPLILFYLEEHSYREIAEILGVPPGTVMSRISRGKALLRRLLADDAPGHRAGQAEGTGEPEAAPPERKEEGILRRNRTHWQEAWMRLKWTEAPERGHPGHSTPLLPFLVVQILASLFGQRCGQDGRAPVFAPVMVPHRGRRITR